ncbi:MAG: MauE/DoxX family redox-associated membrane protein [Planctomycetota bacterium]
MNMDSNGTFARYWSVALLVLMTSTWTLWLPPSWTDTLVYPNVPYVAAASWLSGLAWIGVLIAMGISLLSTWSRRASIARSGWWGLLVCLTLAVAADQHRLQPWVYQSMIYASILAIAPGSSTRWIRWVAISIYAYSAAGKLDAQFIHTVGQDFLDAATQVVGVDSSVWPLSRRVKFAFAFPIYELIVAACLAVPQLRRLGAYLAIALHLGLIVMLSPWQLDHSLGVIVWNVTLVGQAWLLFESPSSDHASSSAADHAASRPFRVPRLVSRLVTTLVIALPLSERRGIWDHWTSWALYSPHSSRFEWYIPESQISKWPDAIREAAMDDADNDGWCEVSLSRLSLSCRGVPVVPQARYQIQLASRLRGQNVPTGAVRGVLKSVSDRWTGQRQQTLLFNARDVNAAASDYWVGVVDPIASSPK